MQKIKSYASIAILAIIFLLGILKSFKAEAFLGNKFATSCICCLDGEAVGNAIDCVSGSGTCAATLCQSGAKVCAGGCE
jgi:hypothetical protein